MQTDILIAGAGLAGLSLALTLRDRPFSSLLVEARQRSGGRILTLETEVDGPGKTLADIGPSWIWPGQHRIEALLQQQGIDVFEQFSTGLLVYEDESGTVRRDLDFSTMAGSLRVVGGLARLTRALAGQVPESQLLYGHRVTRIEHRDNAYQVDIAHGGKSLRVEAHKVLLAIPPRVALRDITFKPALTPAAAQDLAAIPTWMAGHAKLFAIYATPFWREQGLSGDAISRQGPLMEIHDASPADGAYGALFGFVGLPVASPLRKQDALYAAVTLQLERLFGSAAATPLALQVKDWAADPFTATRDDAISTSHPTYGFPESLAELADQGLIFASTEMASEFGGFVEGALEAAEAALGRL